tara:strand:- start:454 stop:855 length:402 start_codon:yes stop_codon:yes gene_type:complete
MTPKIKFVNRGTKTSRRTLRSQYHYEKFVKPLKIKADKAQEKFKYKEYEWEADYGDGRKLHTEKIVEEKEEKDWIDSCLMNIPPTDYAKWKALEKDITAFDEGLALVPNFIFMKACLYFFTFYSLPLLILIYI